MIRSPVCAKGIEVRLPTLGLVLILLGPFLATSAFAQDGPTFTDVEQANIKSLDGNRNDFTIQVGSAVDEPIAISRKPGEHVKASYASGEPVDLGVPSVLDAHFPCFGENDPDACKVDRNYKLEIFRKRLPDGASLHPFVTKTTLSKKNPMPRVAIYGLLTVFVEGDTHPDGGGGIIVVPPGGMCLEACPRNGVFTQVLRDGTKKVVAHTHRRGKGEQALAVPHEHTWVPAKHAQKPGEPDTELQLPALDGESPARIYPKQFFIGCETTVLIDQPSVASIPDVGVEGLMLFGDQVLGQDKTAGSVFQDDSYSVFNTFSTVVWHDCDRDGVHLEKPIFGTSWATHSKIDFQGKDWAGSVGTVFSDPPVMKSPAPAPMVKEWDDAVAHGFFGKDDPYMLQP